MPAVADDGVSTSGTSSITTAHGIGAAMEDLSQDIAADSSSQSGKSAATPNQTEAGEQDKDVILVVDLDRALVATDLLWESVLELVRVRPWQVVKLPLWLFQGRACLTRQLARHVDVGVDTLPFRPEVVQFVDSQRRAARTIVMVTAAEEHVARAIADHLSLGDGILAAESDSKSRESRQFDAIQRQCGAGCRFDYVGDAKVDGPILSSARRVILVGPSRRLSERVQRSGAEFGVIRTQSRGFTQAIRALRPHQWAKNVLLFVPLITAHRLSSPADLLRAIIAFASFCMAASSCYLLNDMMDLRADRRHHSKKSRPLASGRLAIPAGLFLWVALTLGAFGSAASLGTSFVAMVFLYIMLTTTYSLFLKRKLMVDVLSLGALYTHRILSGGVATGIVISPWLLAFSLFFFLSLAFSKRYTELQAAAGLPGKLSGRGYVPGDLEMIRSMGTSSGYICVLVFCLYINSEDVVRLYHKPWLLWIVCLILLYWISRLWFLAQRGELHHDPVVFALRDRISYFAGLLVAAILIAAS
jgi:4-hydroxybenzoate polyprenyltransferase